MQLSSSLIGLCAALLTGVSATPTPIAHGPRGDAVGPRVKRDYNSNNWCGMVKNYAASTVEATWANPSASAVQAGGEYEAYQWVGIDGASANCQRILQAGTGQYIYTNGTFVTFWWYEFYPASPILVYEGINTGDQVHVKVEATSATYGNIYLENLTTGYRNQIPLTSTQGGLCFETVEWIQEGPLTGSKLPSFPSFTMSSCAAGSNQGTTDVSGSTPWYMTDNNGQTVCHARQSGSSVEFDYR